MDTEATSHIILQRPDLDGLRLQQAGSPQVWLVFHGVRHLIPGPSTYDALWSEVEGIVPYHDVTSIEQGPPISEGACLIRPEGSLSIYLVTMMDGDRVGRHFIPTYESLVGFGFDETKVYDLPSIIVNAVPEGVEIVSASDRAARR